MESSSDLEHLHRRFSPSGGNCQGCDCGFGLLDPAPARDQMIDTYLNTLWLVWRKYFDWCVWASLVTIVGGILLTSVTELSFNCLGSVLLCLGAWLLPLRLFLLNLFFMVINLT
ncbi:unnamed protein product, partial [Eruca vesicaria subsp. sativa]|nr:unnamed protein product [Eruca vesicaria subsp. sativa]CAH8306508.1 unnamed protein product [Eruca vesicaria subsp. sativa]